MSVGKKLLVVFGATGNQGGSVISTILASSPLSSKYSLRGITRDTNSEKSQALTARGVEMTRADLDDPASLQKALSGAYGVFGVTDFWALMSKEKEVTYGKSLVDASIHAGVRHLVWSSLPNVTKLSNGKFTHVSHFDSKAAVEEYAEQVKGSKLIVSYFMPAMFMDALYGLAQRGEKEDSIALAFPFPSLQIPWPLLAPSRDTGKFVAGILEKGEEANGVEVQGVSEWVTPESVTKALENVTGKKVAFNLVDGETYKGFLPPPIKEELGQMMQWIGEGSYFGLGSDGEKQVRSNAFLVQGAELTKWETLVRESRSD